MSGDQHSESFLGASSGWVPVGGASFPVSSLSAWP